MMKKNRMQMAGVLAALKINQDYFGAKRKESNPFPGPFENLVVHRQKIKVWARICE